MVCDHRPEGVNRNPASSSVFAWAAQLRDIAHLVESMADALDEDDGILGSLAGQGLANHLPALPKHIRDVFMEYLSDEAAAGYAADVRYFETVS
jgi:hypothetical protein